MATARIEVTLSRFASALLASALDLMVEVLEADPVLVTDEVREKAEAMLAVVQNGRGHL